MDAPMARALMKKSLDDAVVVKTLQGEQHYVVTDITYQPPE